MANRYAANLAALFPAFQSATATAQNMQDQQRQAQADALNQQLMQLRIKEQKMQLDNLKLAQEKEKMRMEYKDQFLANLGGQAYQEPTGAEQGSPRGSSLDANAGRSSDFAQMDDQQRGLQLMSLAAQGGMGDLYNAGVEQGYIDTPAAKRAQEKMQLEQAKNLLDIQKKNIDIQAGQLGMLKTQQDMQVANLGMANTQQQMGVRASQEKRDVSTFAQNYKKAQLELREANFRSQLGTQLLQSDNPTEVQAGQAILSGDYKGGFDMLTGGMTDNELFKRIKDGDPVAAQIMQYKIDAKQKGGVSITSTKDGTTVTMGDPTDAPYPANLMAKDLEQSQGIQNTLTKLSDLEQLVRAYPGQVGPGGATTQFVNNMATWMSRSLGGEEIKIDPKADAAQRMKTLELELLRGLVKSLGANPSDRDVSLIRQSLGGGGFLSTATAEQKISAINQMRESLMNSVSEIQGRPAEYAAKAPKRQPTALQKKIGEILTGGSQGGGDIPKMSDQQLLQEIQREMSRGQR